MARQQLLVRIVSIVAVAGMLHSQPAFAQEPSPGTTDSGAPPVMTSASPDEPDSNVVGKRPSSAQAADATFSYYMVSGATMSPRDSTTTIDYATLGCTRITAGGDYLNTELHIPEGSVIKYLRLIYIDSSATGYVSGALTRYTPGVAIDDLAIIQSSAAGAGGYNYVVSNEMTETVNNGVYAYALLGLTSGTNVQLCGLRVAYYAPPIWAAFTPAIMR